MKVFGIGLNKTGTTTLGSALEILGFQNHVKSDLSLLKNWEQADFDPLWEVIERNNVFEDWPWPLVYEKVFERYDEAKFILTTRSDEHVWFRSLCKHAEKTGPTEHRKIVYGSYMPHDFEDHYKKYYLQHNAAVENFFLDNAPDRLLKICWEHGHGWNELCEYLGVVTPKKKFPILNRSGKYSLRGKVGGLNPFKKRKK